MDDDRHIQPGASAKDDPHSLKTQERNVFYATLAPHAKQTFLDALERAKSRGLSDDEAWREAAIAAETAYPVEGGE